MQVVPVYGSLESIRSSHFANCSLLFTELVVCGRVYNMLSCKRSRMEDTDIFRALVDATQTPLSAMVSSVSYKTYEPICNNMNFVAFNMRGNDSESFADLSNCYIGVDLQVN